MIITRQLKPYLVSSQDSIQSALQKINQNSRRLVFSVSEHGVLEGLVTDGDFRRWVVNVDEIDLSRPVQDIANGNPLSSGESEEASVIEALFSPKIVAIPILDKHRRVVAIAWNEDHQLRFGARTVREDKPAFVIAEIGNNHNGSLDQAKRLIDAAAVAGADCAKFQLRDMDSLYHSVESSSSEDLGSEYTLDLLKRFQLSVDEMYAALDYTRECGMVPLCTPWDEVSLHRLDDYGLEGFKIASADLTNHALLKVAAKFGKPLLLSTGMSSEQEIISSSDLLRKLGAPFALLQCNSTYPTPFNDINLAYLDRLKEISAGLVGYSGHERGYEVCIAAVARGAKIIEKHFTLDREMEGNDHRISLLPNEFSAMVKSIRNVEAAIGTGSDRVVSQGERLNREVLAKSLITARPIRKGEKISEDMIESRSPGKGLQPNRLEDLVGVTACRDMEPGDIFYESDILGESVQARRYQFDRPWGIPVRYHDFDNLTEKVSMDFVEFHLSYRDLDLVPDNYFESRTDLGLVVHSPELFSGDHVMDLAADNQAYLSRSLKELQRVIDRTRELKRFFPRSPRPLIIVNAGGFSSDHFIAEEHRQPLYDRIGEALQTLDEEGVEIIPQTMPPFPWHFGGQRYHNLFLNSEEIVRFCETYDRRICYDISHTKLACNYFDWSMQHFTRDVGPYVAHLHIVDAAGHHDEGLQIGEGEIDFESVFNDLQLWIPGVSFIPEIWQGHKNSGEGFWIALDRLERNVTLGDPTVEALIA